MQEGHDLQILDQYAKLSFNNNIHTVHVYCHAYTTGSHKNLNTRQCFAFVSAASKEYRCMLFQNRVLGEQDTPKRGEVTWAWRKLQGRELLNLYSSPKGYEIKNMILI